MRSSLIALAALVLALAAPAAAQEPGAPPAADTLRRSGLPPEVAEEVVAFFNDTRTLHFSGRTRIPEERAISGDVAVLGGPLVVAGRIQGRVVVINGGVELLPGAVVDGDLTVIGGEITGLDSARVGGDVVSYSERLSYSHDGDRIVHRDRRRGRAGEDDRRGRGTLQVSAGQGYNRVEGLPVHFGPIVRTGGSNPTRFRALAIYRTEEGRFLRTDRWGHDVGVEQYLGGERAFRVGAGLLSVVAPIEEWHLSDTENSLSTFLFHRDFRDHYERKGWNAFAALEPRGGPFSLRVEYRSEKHASVGVGDPWTIFDNGDAWRQQPLVGEGRLNSLLATAGIDTRNDREDPSTGWHVRGRVEHALDSELTRPAAVRAVFGPMGDTRFVPVPATPFDAFTAGWVDVRRYNRLSAGSRFNLRLVAGGSLDGSALPPQRQHVLGGEGSLPGYSLFRFDCGARRTRVLRAGREAREGLGPDDDGLFVPSYGCDRVALVQAEYRGSFGFHVDWNRRGRWSDEDREAGHDADVDADLEWALFMDAGRGWAHRRELDEETGVDAGVGLLFGDVGVYAAVPLRRGSGVNLFVRLGPRF